MDASPARRWALDPVLAVVAGDQEPHVPLFLDWLPTQGAWGGGLRVVVGHVDLPWWAGPWVGWPPPLTPRHPPAPGRDVENATYPGVPIGYL